MAETQLSIQSAKQVWRRDAWREYIRESRFAPYTGRSPIAGSSKASGGPMPIISIIDDLTNTAGNAINIPLVTRLRGPGVSGSQILVGNEDDISNYNARVFVDFIRKAIVIPKSTSFKTEMDLWNIGKSLVRDWFAEKLRDNLIQSAGSIIIPNTVQDPNTGESGPGADTYVNYASSSATQRNTFLTNNNDRILMGANVANTSSLVWATSLANIDSANDRASTGMFSLAKRIATSAGSGSSLRPHVRPYKVPENGREYYVAFCATNTFRDIQADTAMISANRDARAREGRSMDDNPLFQDGDLEYNGIIYVWFPELDQLKLIGAGAAGIDVDRNFMMGQQALALAYSQILMPHTDLKRDYEFRPGFAMDECRGQIKLSFNGTQLGVVEVDTASIPDV